MTAPLPSVWLSLVLLGALRQQASMMEQLRGRVGGIGLKLRAGRIAFDINQGAARQAGVKLSSQLLKLADEVLP